MENKILKYSFNLLKVICIIVTILFIIPNNLTYPIKKNEFIKIDSNSFWYYPWGQSGVHRGIDIFCKKNANVYAPIYGVIIKKGFGTISGNYIYLLGPKLRLYYFAHLDTIIVNKLSFVSKGELLAKAGNTGNAKDTPIHLHFSIETLIPYYWLIEKNEVEGYNKMYYLNPNNYLPY